MKSVKAMNEVYTEYAQALFSLGTEQGKERLYSEELAVIGTAFKENPEYKELLCSPAIGNDEKLKCIDEAFKGKVSLDVLNFLKLLTQKKRISKIESCIEEYSKLLNDYERTTVAKVKSAVSLSEEEKQRLTEKISRLTGKKVRLELSIDEELIGGIVIEVDGKILDGSIKQKLRDIKEVMDR